MRICARVDSRAYPPEQFEIFLPPPHLPPPPLPLNFEIMLEKKVARKKSERKQRRSDFCRKKYNMRRGRKKENEQVESESSQIFNEIDLHFRIINAMNALNFYFTRSHERANARDGWKFTNFV